MQPQALYVEVQQMVSKPVRQALWVLSFFFGASTIIQWVQNEFILTDTAATFLIGCVLFTIFALVALVKMTTTFTTTGIMINYFPFYANTRLFAWEEIAEAQVRPYNALQEHWGWGVRFNASGMAYSVIGNRSALQLRLKNSSTVLISTAQPGVIEEVLHQLHQNR